MEDSPSTDIDAPKIYRVSRNKTFSIPDKLEGEHIFKLTGVSLVPDDGRPFSFAVYPNKNFVPSFDRSKETTTSILMWASREPAEEARVKIRAEIDIKENTVKVTGSGFQFVEITVRKVEKPK